MLKRMAYRFLELALVALVAAACVKTIEREPSGDTDAGWTDLDSGLKPISFKANTADTRSIDPTSGLSEFRVFAFYQSGNLDPANHYTGSWSDLGTKNWTPNFMYDQRVEWYDNGTPAVPSDDYWRYSPVKYWPNNEENTLTFWAYSPYYGDQHILKLYKTNSDDDYANDVPGTPEAQFGTDGTRDLLFSELARDLSHRGGDPSTVTLHFHHATSWIDFKVKKVDPDDNYDIVLKSIKLEHVCDTAVYTLNGWGSAWHRVVFSAYDCGAGAGTDLDKDDRITFPTGGDKLLLIPQAFRNTTANLEIVYTFHVKGSASEPVEYEENMLLGNLTQRWEEGKRYTYNVNISPGNPILFTTYVAAWDSEQNGYFNVN